MLSLWGHVVNAHALSTVDWPTVRRCRSLSARRSSARYSRRPDESDARCNERPYDRLQGAPFRLHPRFECDVFVRAAIDKADAGVFRCTLNGSEAGRWLEIPAWMFDHGARITDVSSVKFTVAVCLLCSMPPFTEDATAIFAIARGLWAADRC
jgi:hypothetical protein